MKWEVQECVNDKWVSLWKGLKNKPIRFPTKIQAQIALTDFFGNVDEACRNGNMDKDCINKDDFRIVKV
jgi:hypothetical protein